MSQESYPMSVGKRAGDIARNRSFFFAITLMLLMIPLETLHTPSDTEGTGEAATRGFGDIGPDTGVVDVIFSPHRLDETYANTSQSIDVEIANYFSINATLSVWVNLSIENSLTHAQEPRIPGWNATLVIANGTSENDTFSWTPSSEGDYDITVKCGNVSTWGEEIDYVNNTKTISITIQNTTDAQAGITSMADGNSYPNGKYAIDASVNNGGNVDITTDFNVKLLIKNFTTNATDFNDTQSIPCSTVPLPPGNSFPVTFADWTPSAPGNYSITITTMLPGDSNAGNDVSTIRIEITPVYFYNFSLLADPMETFAKPGGDQVQISFTIENTGSLQDNYTYTISSGQGWLVGDNPTKGTATLLDPGESTTIDVFVLVPQGTGFDKIDGVNMTAISVGNGSVYRNAVCYVYTWESHEVDVTLQSTPAYGDPGDTLTYTFRVTNNGNIGEKFDITLSTTPDVWNAYISGQTEPFSTSFIAPGLYEDVAVTLEIPELNYETREEDHTYAGAISYLTLMADSLHTSDSGTVVTTVNSVAAAEIKANRTMVTRNPEPHTQKVNFQLSIRNINNALQGGTSSWNTMDLDVQTVMFLANWSGQDFDSERWSAKTTRSNVTVGGGEIDDTVRLSIFVPPNPYNGSCYIVVTAVPRDEPTALPDYVEIYVHITQVAGVNVSTDAPTLQEGAPTDELTYTFSIENTGNGGDTYILTPSSEHNWSTEIVGGVSSVIVFPDEIATVSVETTVPPYVAETADVNATNIGDEDNLTLTVTSSFNRKIYDSSNATTRVKQGFAIELEPEENTSSVDAYQNGVAGKPVKYTINVTNLGNGDDTVNLIETHDSLPGWSVELSSLTIPVTKGTSVELEVTVSAGAAASAEDSFKVQIIGVSMGDATKTDTANVTTVVKQYPGINVTLLSSLQESGVPGDTIVFLFQVTNTGNGNDTMNFTVSNSTEDNAISWEAELNKETATISPFNEIVLELTVMIPAIAEGDMEDELIAKGIVAGTIKKFNLTAGSGVETHYTVKKDVSVIVDSLYDPRLSATITEDDVLPLRTAVYSINVINKGNEKDEIRFENQPSHPGVGELSLDSIQLDPGTSETITLEVTPDTNGSNPFLGEEYTNRITPISNNGTERGTSIKFTTTITFLDLSSPSEPNGNIHISQDGNEQSIDYTFEIMNVPSYNGEPNIMDTFEVAAGTHQGEIESNGWEWRISPSGSKNMTFPLSSFYESSEFTLTLISPSKRDEIGKEIIIDVSATSPLRPGMHREIKTTTRVVYVDLSFNGKLKFNKARFDEGGSLKITAALVAKGTVPVDDVEVSLYINKGFIGSVQTGELALSSSNQQMTVGVEFTWNVPNLQWDEKAEKYDIVLKIDKDGTVYETSDKDIDAEKNNELKGEILVRDDAIPAVVSVLFIFMFGGAAIYLWKTKRIEENRGLYMAYGVFSAVIMGSLFALPWDSFGLSASGATTWGKILIWFTLIAIFSAVAAFISLNSRRYIESLINQKAKKDKLKYEFFKRDNEEGKDKWQLISDDKTFKPYLIACVGAFIQAPIFFLVISLNSDFSLVLSLSLIGILYAALSGVAVFYFIRYNLTIYDQITNAEKLIDDIRENTLKEVRLAVEPIASEGQPSERPPKRERPRGRPPRGRRRPPGGPKGRRRRRGPPPKRRGKRPGGGGSG